MEKYLKFFFFTYNRLESVKPLSAIMLSPGSNKSKGLLSVTMRRSDTLHVPPQALKTQKMTPIE